MNTDLSEIGAEPEFAGAERESNPPEPPRRSGSGLAFLALLIALAALAATAWFWWQGQSSDSAVAGLAQSEFVRLDGNDSRLSAQIQELRKALESLPEGDHEARFAALEKALSEEQARATALQQALQEQAALARSTQSAIDAMHGRLVAAESSLARVDARELDARGNLDLAEVDYLLRLANERVQLFSEPRSADRALALAAAHLAALDKPVYLGVRQAIAAARTELAAMDLPDDLEIAGQLEAIQEAIPGWPFQLGSPAAAEIGTAVETGWWEKLKSTLGSLVTVRRSTEDENQRISLEDKDYVRQRIWLQLEIAHLALMRRDQQAFRSSLERVRESLADWFVNDDAFRLVDADIETLQGIDIDVEVPDITAPWSTLRLLRNATPVPAVAPVEMPAEQPVEPDVVPGETDDGSTEAEG